MACVHLKELYRLCEKHDLKIAGADLVRVVCPQCGEQEVCPSTLTDWGSEDEESSPPGIEAGQDAGCRPDEPA